MASTTARKTASTARPRARAARPATAQPVEAQPATLDLEAAMTPAPVTEPEAAPAPKPRQRKPRSPAVAAEAHDIAPEPSAAEPSATVVANTAVAPAARSRRPARPKATSAQAQDVTVTSATPTAPAEVEAALAPKPRRPRSRNTAVASAAQEAATAAATPMSTTDAEVDTPTQLLLPVETEQVAPQPPAEAPAVPETTVEAAEVTTEDTAAQDTPPAQAAEAAETVEATPNNAAQAAAEVSIPEVSAERTPEIVPEPEPAAPVAPVPELPLHSSITLLTAPDAAHDQRCRLQWEMGRHCPAELQALALTLDTTTEAAPLANDLAVLEMQRLARERRHALHISEAVWAWLAQARDMRERVLVLERAHPDGPYSAALQALVQVPLRTYQAEGALYAACAGRSLLADDAGLGKTVQALTAAQVMATHFGALHALVLCPPERREHWQRQWAWLTTPAAPVVSDASAEPDLAVTPPASTAALTLTVEAHEALLSDLPRLQALDADLIIVDESATPASDDHPDFWQQAERVQALHQLPSSFALAISRHPLRSRPQAWRAMLGWVDVHRFGALDHLEHWLTWSGAASVNAATDEPDAEVTPALGAWQLRRTKTRVLRQLPETLEATLPVALSEATQARHAQLHAELRRLVQRWQRSQYLSDAHQRQLLTALHALRQCCNADKTEATLATINALRVTPDTKVAVFSQWPQDLDALAQVLQERGIGHRLLSSGPAGTLSPEARRTLVNEFQQDPDVHVLLCSDDERGGQLGLRHAATALLHLDRPWNPALLHQRLTRIHRTDRVRQVMVRHLIAADSAESRLVQAQEAAATRELFVGLLEGPNAEVFLRDSRLSRLMSAVEAVLGTEPAATQPSPEGSAQG